MTPAVREGVGVTLAGWLAQIGLGLEPEEAIVFLDAARELLPAKLGLDASLQAGAPPSQEQQDALRALWLRTGAPPPAPCPMPLHPLSPGVIGASWRRLRETWSHPPRTESE